MTVKVGIQLDMDSYIAKYGPGSEWAKKYDPDGERGLGTFKEGWLEEAIHEVLEEGFYDWSANGWLKVQIHQS